MPERIDDLKIAGLKIIQSKNGYRFSLDPVLLCSFTNVAAESFIVDLGTASGIIPLLLASRNKTVQIVGVEIQEALAERAERNVNMNHFQDVVSVLHEDLRTLNDTGALAAGCADLVLSNPPYRSVGSGRLALHGERARCRHDIDGTLADFVKAASYLLKNKGRLSLIFLTERLAETLDVIRAYQLEPKRLRYVHSNEYSESHLFLLEAIKGGKPGLKVEAPCYIYSGDNYSEEIQQMFTVREEGPDFI